MANITVEEVILHLTSPLHRCPYLSDNPGDNPGGGPDEPIEPQQSIVLIDDQHYLDDTPHCYIWAYTEGMGEADILTNTFPGNPMTVVGESRTQWTLDFEIPQWVIDKGLDGCVFLLFTNGKPLDNGGKQTLDLEYVRHNTYVIKDNNVVTKSRSRSVKPISTNTIYAKPCNFNELPEYVQKIILGS